MVAAPAISEPWPWYLTRAKRRGGQNRTVGVTGGASDVALAVRSVAVKATALVEPGGRDDVEQYEPFHRSVGAGDSDWLATPEPRVGVTSLLAGGAALIFVVALVVSVLAMSNGSTHRVIQVDPPVLSTVKPPPAPVRTPVTTTVTPPVATPAAPTLVGDGPTAATKAPGPPPATPSATETKQAPPDSAFPRLHQWFPRLFPGR